MKVACFRIGFKSEWYRSCVLRSQFKFGVWADRGSGSNPESQTQTPKHTVAGGKGASKKNKTRPKP